MIGYYCISSSDTAIITLCQEIKANIDVSTLMRGELCANPTWKTFVGVFVKKTKLIELAISYSYSSYYYCKIIRYHFSPSEEMLIIVKRKSNFQALATNLTSNPYYLDSYTKECYDQKVTKAIFVGTSIID